jgi:hypothetical protein
MTTISQVQRKFVTNLEKRLLETEQLALVLSSQMTPDQFARIPSEYREQLSALMDRIGKRGLK